MKMENVIVLIIKCYICHTLKLTVPSWFEDTVHGGGKAQWQEYEAVGHIASKVRKQRDNSWGSASFSIVSSLSSSFTNIKVKLPSLLHLNLSRNTPGSIPRNASPRWF